MNGIRTLVLKRTEVLLFLVLLGTATLAPLTGNQFISGTIVNCALFLAVCSIGIQAALLIGIIPSVIALATGLLPPILAPMIPFIILGNIILVVVMDKLRKMNYWLGAAAGAFLKFGLLNGVSSIVFGLLMNRTLAAHVSYMMSWPQLVTALAGSIAAFGILFAKRKLDYKQ